VTIIEFRGTFIEFAISLKAIRDALELKLDEIKESRDPKSLIKVKTDRPNKDF